MDRRIKTFRGDVRDAQAVVKAMRGQHAALVALGVTPGKSGHVLSSGTSNVIDAMKLNGGTRIITETGAGLVESKKLLPFIWKVVTSIPPMKNMFDEKREQESCIQNSGLEWVIVRPTNLTNGVQSEYEAGEQVSPHTSSTISRANVADFMVNPIQSDKWLGKAVILVQ